MGRIDVWVRTYMLYRAPLLAPLVAMAGVVKMGQTPSVKTTRMPTSYSKSQKALAK